MFSKIINFALIVAVAQAIPLETHGGSYATSYASSNLGSLGGASNHGAIGYAAAPAQISSIGYAAPVATQHISSIGYAAPVATQQISSIGYAAPVVAKYAAPAIVQKYVAPAVVHKYAVPTVVQKYATPVYAKAPIIEEQYGPAKYEFHYEVADSHTGDIKSQHEIRDGDVVKGEYSLHEPDGTVRTVQYTADDHNGFNAVVSRSGHAAHPQAVATKAVVAAAPVYAGHGGYYNH